MIATRTSLIPQAATLVGVLAIGSGVGLAFAVPAGPALQARLQGVRAILDGSALRVRITAVPEAWHR